jgi:hypothetical protein
LDREVGFIRDRQGNWRTIPKVDLVVVAVPADDKVRKRRSVEAIEVFGFDPKVLKREFDAALAAQLERHPDLSYKAPIFVSLDKVPGRASSSSSSSSSSSVLKTKNLWREELPLNSMALHGDVGFIERVKREFAELMGVDVSRVTVDFHINA